MDRFPKSVLLEYPSHGHAAANVGISLESWDCRGMDGYLNKSGILSEHRRYTSLTRMMKLLCHCGINLTENHKSTKRNRACYEHGASLVLETNTLQCKSTTLRFYFTLGNVTELGYKEKLIVTSRRQHTNKHFKTIC